MPINIKLIKFKGTNGAEANSIGKVSANCFIANIRSWVSQSWEICLTGLWGTFKYGFFEKAQREENILTFGNVTVKLENNDFEVPNRQELLLFVSVNGKVGKEVLVPGIKTKSLTVLNSIKVVDETKKVPVSKINRLSYAGL